MSQHLKRTRLNPKRFFTYLVRSTQYSKNIVLYNDSEKLLTSSLFMSHLWNKNFVKNVFDVRDFIGSVRFVVGWSRDRIRPPFWKKLAVCYTNVGFSSSKQTQVPLILRFSVLGSSLVRLDLMETKEDHQKVLAFSCIYLKQFYPTP